MITCAPVACDRIQLFSTLVSTDKKRPDKTRATDKKLDVFAGWCASIHPQPWLLTESNKTT